MTETTRLTTVLPGFGGFHGTPWENLLPFSREMRADRFARDEGAEGLDGADYSEILRETSDTSRFFTSLAARFCRRYDAESSRRLGFRLGLTFSGLDIPATAGGTTDFILATMPVRSARKLLARSAEEGHHRLVESIRGRFAPYDGVVPYPDDAVEQWLTEPIERWGRVLRDGQRLPPLHRPRAELLRALRRGDVREARLPAGPEVRQARMVRQGWMV